MRDFDFHPSDLKDICVVNDCNHFLNSRAEMCALQYTCMSPVSSSSDDSYGHSGDNVLGSHV